MALVLAGILGFARFGDPRRMPGQLERLAIKLGNPRTLTSQVTPAWGELCRAWAGWLGYLERNALRLVRTRDLWKPDDPLRMTLESFAVNAGRLRPGSLVPEAAGKADLLTLGASPSAEVLSELLTNRVATRVESAGTDVLSLAVKLERWPEWDRMRSLLNLCRDRGFNQVAVELERRLPPTVGSPGYRMNPTRTLKLLNDLAVDQDGMRGLANRWSDFTRLADALQASGDPERQGARKHAFDQLNDQPTLRQFPDSLSVQVEEMQRRIAGGQGGTP